MDIEVSIKDKVAQFFSQKRTYMGDTLGIQFLTIRKNELRATMPVNEHTIQPFGILHGGASVALSETICSLGAWVNIKDPNKNAVGIEVNANHIRPVLEGESVIGIAKPIRRGAKIQVWECRVETKNGKLVCISRCTLAVVNKR